MCAEVQILFCVIVDRTILNLILRKREILVGVYYYLLNVIFHVIIFSEKNTMVFMHFNFSYWKVVHILLWVKGLYSFSAYYYRTHFLLTNVSYLSQYYFFATA